MSTEEISAVGLRRGPVADSAVPLGTLRCWVQPARLNQIRLEGIGVNGAQKGGLPPRDTSRLRKAGSCGPEPPKARDTQAVEGGGSNPLPPFPPLPTPRGPPPLASKAGFSQSEGNSEYWFKRKTLSRYVVAEH